MPVYTGGLPPYVDEDLSSENPLVEPVDLQRKVETVENDINDIIFHKKNTTMED